MTKFKLSVLVSAFLISGSAISATQGSLDTSSTGTSDVTIIKDNAVQISKVDDLNFGTEAMLANNAELTDDVCVFSSTGKYSITVSSSGDGFALVGTGTDPAHIDYTVKWGTQALVHGGVHGDGADGLIANATSLTCDGSTNAEFTVTVDSTSFNSAKPDTYSDTLTLMVEPE